jgi:hypothetical protein
MRGMIRRTAPRVHGHDKPLRGPPWVPYAGPVTITHPLFAAGEVILVPFAFRGFARDETAEGDCATLLADPRTRRMFCGARFAKTGQSGFVSLLTVPRDVAHDRPSAVPAVRVALIRYNFAPDTSRTPVRDRAAEFHVESLREQHPNLYWQVYGKPAISYDGTFGMVTMVASLNPVSRARR